MKIKDGYEDKNTERRYGNRREYFSAKPSVEIAVEPPPSGKIEIEKVDAKDSTLKLKMQSFKLLIKMEM